MNEPTNAQPEPIGFSGYTPAPAVLADVDKRFTYHSPIPTQIARYGVIRNQAKALAHVLLANAPASRELSTALTHLDAVVMFANAAIARNES